MKRERSGLTLIEILVVVGVIAILVGMLVPSLRMVKNAAREVKQKAQFTAIGLGLEAFKNDYGEYPPSNWWDPAAGGSAPQNYCGAQKLAEAMLGWDLLGFNPDSTWEAGAAIDQPPAPYAAGSLDKRKGRYVELENVSAFYLDEVFPGSLTLAPYTRVLCDVFEVPSRRIQRGDGEVVSPGTPILYYRADPASKTIFDPAVLPEDRIYNGRDNAPLVAMGRVADYTKATRDPHLIDPAHPVNTNPQEVDTSDSYFSFFYQRYIRDSQVRPRYWPYRPDSYILASAGPDGWYGTPDDICNFRRR